MKKQCNIPPDSQPSLVCRLERLKQGLAGDDKVLDARLARMRRFPLTQWFGEHPERLEELCVDTVVVVGVCTHICILHTAIGAYNNGFEVIVPRDAVATFDPAYEEFALEHMKSILGAKIL